MFYAILKTICKTALKVYFRNIHVEGKKNIPENGPYIIVANHPNSFLDPVCVAVYAKSKLSFLAKGVLFKNKIIAWMLKRLNMIPIHRAEDNPKLLIKNTEVFEHCYKKLKKKHVIMLFPEGTSEMERRLRKIKTGAARIALGAEKDCDFSLGIKILPVGLNYTNSSRFRSEAFINFGEPIAVSEYIEQYKLNEVQAVKQLTDDIETAIKNLMVTIDSYEHEQITEKVEALYQNTLDSNTSLNKVKSSQAIIDAISYFQKTNPQLFDYMANKIDCYFLKVDQLNISHKSVEKIDNRKKWFPEMLISFFAIIMGFPLWLFGFLSSYIPYKLPRIVALGISKSESFYGALLMSLGTLFFILFYSAEIAMFGYITNNAMLTLLFGVVLIIAGFFTIYYARNARRFFFNLKLVVMLARKKEMIKEVAIERKRLITELDTLSQEYLNRKD